MSLNSIDLGLREVLRDPKRRHEFFKAITEDEIAAQIRSLRKKRVLTQSAFAELAEMKQSAVSRIEQADYSSWSLTTLFRVASVLNARWKITLEPCEEAVAEIERLEESASDPLGGQAVQNFFRDDMGVQKGQRSAFAELSGSAKNVAAPSSELRDRP